MSTREKVAENRVRRALQRRGLTLQKSARRDPGSITYGLYRVLRAENVMSDWMTLEAIENVLANTTDVRKGAAK